MPTQNNGTHGTHGLLDIHITVPDCNQRFVESAALDLASRRSGGRRMK